jgi:hypothetical protein
MNIRLVVFFIALTGCTDMSSGNLPGDPYERWKMANLHNYTIDQMLVCFCADGGETVRITVQADSIASLFRLSDSSNIPFPESRRYLTADSLFAIIKHPGSDSLVTAYNAIYGYPEKLDINPQMHPVDGGVLYQSSNLQVR